MIFQSAFPDTKETFEAVVLSVDGHRNVCCVRSVRGAYITGVRWLKPLGSTERQGDNSEPRPGELVFVNSSSGNPIIMGSLSLMDDGFNYPAQISSSSQSPDTGNNSEWKNKIRLSSSRPKDQVVGDRVITTDGGGMIAALRSGTILAKATGLAQILLSPINHLVRIVGRNYEVFTDTFLDVTKNFKGRAYRFVGYSDTPENVRKDDYKHYEVHGDVSAGENLKGNYWGADINSLPSVGTAISKKVTRDSSGNLLTEIWNLNGSKVTTVQKGGGSPFAKVDQENNSLTMTVTDGNTAIAQLTGSHIYLNWNSKTITIDSSGITAVNGSQTFKMDGTNIEALNGGQTMKLTSSSSTLAAQGHILTVSSSGIDLF